jgi:HAMP domain-containing protein
MTPSVVEIVNKANQAHQLEDNLEGKISELDEAWKAEDPAVAPLVKEISSNHVSLYLKDSLGILSDEVEIFLTDSYGLNVAMTDRTSDYFQADEGWWQRAYNDGQGAIYISDIEFDESTQTWALDIGMPIRNNEGQEIVGIIRGTLDVSSLFQHFSQFTMGETGQVSIVDKEGKILYTREHDQFLQTISEELLTTIQLDDQGLSTQVNNLAGKPAIVTYRRSDNELVNSLGLTVIVDQELYEVNKYVRTSFRQTLLATAIISIVLLIIIFWIARFISNPLLLATQEAQDLSMGKLSGSVYEDENLYLHHTDEVGKLLGAFQILREYIREIALSAQKLATGNLTITVQSRHEHDQLGNAFNLMISSLRHLISQVARDADDVKEVAGQVAAAS